MPKFTYDSTDKNVIEHVSAMKGVTLLDIHIGPKRTHFTVRINPPFDSEEHDSQYGSRIEHVANIINGVAENVVRS